MVVNKTTEMLFKGACQIGGSLIGDEIISGCVIRPHTAAGARIWMRVTGSLIGGYFGDKGGEFGLRVINSAVKMVKKLEPI